MAMQKTTTPLLSLIVPYHNRFSLLQEALESVPDHESIEILLIDDSSDAGFTPPPFHQARVRQILQEPTLRYAGNARNLGIQQAHGTFVAFLDSDDTLDTHALARILQKLPQSTADVVYCPAFSFNETGADGTRHLYINRGIDAYKTHQNWHHLIPVVSPVVKIYRTGFLQENAISFDTNLHGEDLLFNAAMLLAKPRIAIEEQGYYRIRQEEGSLTTDTSAAAAMDRLQAIMRTNALLRTRGYANLQHSAGPTLRRLWQQNKAQTIRAGLLCLRHRTPIGIVQAVKNRIGTKR